MSRFETEEFTYKVDLDTGTIKVESEDIDNLLTSLHTDGAKINFTLEQLAKTTCYLDLILEPEKLDTHYQEYLIRWLHYSIKQYGFMYNKSLIKICIANITKLNKIIVNSSDEDNIMFYFDFLLWRNSKKKSIEIIMTDLDENEKENVIKALTERQCVSKNEFIKAGY